MFRYISQKAHWNREQGVAIRISKFCIQTPQFLRYSGKDKPTPVGSFPTTPPLLFLFSTALCQSSLSTPFASYSHFLLHYLYHFFSSTILFLCLPSLYERCIFFVCLFNGNLILLCRNTQNKITFFVECLIKCTTKTFLCCESHKDTLHNHIYVIKLWE